MVDVSAGERKRLVFDAAFYAYVGGVKHVQAPSSSTP